MPNITVQWYAGRTDQQKREILAAITDAMEKIGKVLAAQKGTVTINGHTDGRPFEAYSAGWSTPGAGTCRSRPGTSTAHTNIRAATKTQMPEPRRTQ